MSLFVIFSGTLFLINSPYLTYVELRSYHVIIIMSQSYDRISFFGGDFRVKNFDFLNFEKNKQKHLGSKFLVIQVEKDFCGCFKIVFFQKVPIEHHQ